MHAAVYARACSPHIVYLDVYNVDVKFVSQQIVKERMYWISRRSEWQLAKGIEKAISFIA